MMELIRKMHRVWFGTPDARRAAEYATNLEAFRSLHPDWEIMEWNETNTPSKWMALAEGSRNYGELSDIVRMAALHEHGGLYMDHDIEVRCHVRFVLRPGYFCATIYPTLPDHAVNNCFVYSEPGNQILSKLLEHATRHVRKRPNNNWTPGYTGPGALSRLCVDMPNVYLVPDRYVYEPSFSDLKDDSYLIVHRSRFTWQKHIESPFDAL
jgi:mannosyltransferase OCH1-like enzyme